MVRYYFKGSWSSSYNSAVLPLFLLCSFKLETYYSRDSSIMAQNSITWTSICQIGANIALSNIGNQSKVFSLNWFQLTKLTVINTWWGGRPCCQKQFWFGSIEPHFKLECHYISVSLAVSRFRPEAWSMLEDCSNWKFKFLWKKFYLSNHLFIAFSFNVFRSCHSKGNFCIITIFNSW